MGIVRSHSSGLNGGRASADVEASAGAADVFDTVSTMLEGVRDFATVALKDELDGGHFQDEAGAVLDAVSDAIGAAKNAEGKIR
jgi:hypothetical protein